MSPESILTDELRNAIGTEAEPTTIEVDKSVIRRFAEGVGDTNPLWNDDTAAKRSRYGSIVAPPSLIATVLLNGQKPYEKIDSKLPPRVLDGGGEYEILQPIKAGDTITVKAKLADITEKPGRLGTMLILTVEVNWRNQRNELVAKARNTAIRY